MFIICVKIQGFHTNRSPGNDISLEAPQHGCHLAFLKQFARNIMFWPFGHFWPFLNVEENSIFQILFWRNLNKTCNILF
jgi:hypothetical protein